MSTIQIGSRADQPKQSVSLDLDLLLGMLLQAGSGGGKSRTLRRIMEQAFPHIQILCIDPEGEFASLREKFGFVLAGRGGEAATDIRSAELLAHKLLTLKVSAVCDIFEMRPLDRHRWVNLLLNALIDAPKKLWHPVLVIVDEAHIFCPESGQGSSEAHQAMLDMGTRGRKRGFKPIAATQRLAMLDKTFAAMLPNAMIGPTFLDDDCARAAKQIGVATGKDTRAFSDQLKVLEPGHFYAFGRALSRERVLLHVSDVQTSHPEAGNKTATYTPPLPDDIRALLPQLADLPKEADEKAATEGELRARIRELEEKAADVSGEVAASDTNELAVARDDARMARQQLIDLDAERRAQLSTLGGSVVKIREECEFALTAIERYQKDQAAPQMAKPMLMQRSNGEDHSATANHPNQMLQMKHPPMRRLRPNIYAATNGKLRSGAERMLAALAQWYPERMSLTQMRSHAGLKKSGTFDAYLRDLRQGGYVDVNGDMIAATREGLEYFGGNVPKAPRTTDEVLQVWEPKLRDGARRILRVLVQRRGHPVAVPTIYKEAVLSKSGTFDAYMRDLRNARLVTTSKGMPQRTRRRCFYERIRRISQP
jgi:hypothetical protein